MNMSSIILMVTGFMYVGLCLYPMKMAFSGEMTQEMQEMQKQLNNEVLSQPFSVADEAKVQAYISEAQRRGEVPPPYRGKHWRPGYTCHNLRAYSYQEYLSCRYYYHFYGRYYP